METKIIKVKAFRTPDDKPTCGVDFRNGLFCPFYRTEKFGQRPVCLFASRGVSLESYENSDYLKPGLSCIVWEKKNK